MIRFSLRETMNRVITQGIFTKRPVSAWLTSSSLFKSKAEKPKTHSLTLIRDEIEENFTRGSLIGLDGDLQTLEDPLRDQKVYGDTCIPYGTYKLKFREVLSPKTKSYRNRYPEFFKWHIELQDVPNFSSVYCHVGNYTKDTEGCILLGMKRGADTGALVLSSAIAFEKFYKEVAEWLENGDEVILNII